MLKLIVGFISGITISGLLLFGVRTALPIRAQSENFTPSSENFSLVQLLPDIERIYREALTSPLREAEKKIYDKDIAQFYHLLLERSALDTIE